MGTNQNKGDALERAIESIERAILQQDSTLKPERLRIENKKTVIVDGVRHEIDIYVEAEIARGYKSVYIFEAKNWDSNVDKNEVIIFSEKIRALSAQYGFFIARGFTSHAYAQAALDRRIKLLLASEASFDKYPFDQMLVQSRSQFTGNFRLTKRSLLSSSSNQYFDIHVNEAKVVVSGVERNLYEYLDELVNHVYSIEVQTMKVNELPEGAYTMKFSKQIRFEDNGLIYDDLDVATIDMDVTVDLVIYRPRIIFHFDIEGRGRYVELEPYDFGTGHGRLVMSFTAPTDVTDSD